MNTVIKCENVSVRYITGDFKDIGFKEFLMRKLTGNYHVTEFWADKDLSFELKKGDMLGIIGTNGAGKSTLLKTISGVMIPTKGSIQTKGTIAALLELTAGFDDELTVKENTYLRGAMLGYTREFMNEKYDSIIRFAELEGFEERTLKQLSNGMRSRLAFSIACLVNPDILILDEVLAVGDGAFRKKSGDKMRDILRSGVTGILVSHSIDHIKELCNKVLWLDHGRQICFSSDIDACCNAYEEFLVTKRLPISSEEIEKMSKEHCERIKLSESQKYKEEIERIGELLKNADSKTLSEITKMIKEKRPEIF